MKKIVRLLLAMSLSVTILYGLAWSVRITNIECWIQDQPCAESVAMHLTELNHQSVFFTSYQDYFKQQTELQSYELTAISKELPGTIIVHLTPEASIYRLQDLTTQELYLVDHSGKISSHTSLAPLVESELPLSVLQQTTDNKLLPLYHQSIVQLLQSLKHTTIETDNILIKDKYTYEIRLKNGIMSRVPIKEPQLAVARLDVILQELEADLEAHDITVIDVRYRLPVLRKS